MLLVIDEESIRQAEITNTDAEINLIDATTKYEDIESTIMQIEIDGTVQTVLYNVIRDETSTSELVVITDLEGIVYNVFELNDGEILGEVDLNTYTSTSTNSTDTGTDPCWGITCGITLETVFLGSSTSALNYYYTNNITSTTMMSYQFVRSLNNYSTMGTAYAYYYNNYYNNSQTQNPCPEDPVPNLEIAPQTVSGTKGTLFGCTRYGGSCSNPDDNRTKEHKGIDIKNSYGEPIYAMYSGFVYSDGYQVDGAGYNIRIQSIVNGETILVSYFHMQQANMITTNSDGSLNYVNAGDIIGYQGFSGNLFAAIAKGSAESHVHIEVREHNGTNQWGYSNYNLVDPRGYLGTVIDDDGTSQTNSNCN
ncbi:MAG: M23 family metallopeptidase [Bacteroidetes bacterium]|nr:M23 family metallopeptidase [Bacteroidota bacterium]